MRNKKFIISPCKKVAYCPTLKTMTTSMLTYLVKKEKFTPVDEFDTSETVTLFLMREPIERRISGLQQAAKAAQAFTDINDDTVLALYKNNIWFDDQHTQSFYSDLGCDYIFDKLDNCAIIAMDNNLQELFDNFFSSMNLNIRYNDIPVYNKNTTVLASAIQELFKNTKFNTLGLAHDIRIWDIITTNTDVGGRVKEYINITKG